MRSSLVFLGEAVKGVDLLPFGPPPVFSLFVTAAIYLVAEEGDVLKFLTEGPAVGWG